MSAGTSDPDGGPKADVPGFLLLLVVAAIAGACLVAGARFVLRWLESGQAAPPGS